MDPLLPVPILSIRSSSPPQTLSSPSPPLSFPFLDTLVGLIAHPGGPRCALLFLRQIMALDLQPPDGRKRVKVYELRDNDWFDRGTGFCTGQILGVSAGSLRRLGGASKLTAQASSRVAGAGVWLCSSRIRHSRNDLVWLTRFSLFPCTGRTTNICRVRGSA